MPPPQPRPRQYPLLRRPPCAPTTGPWKVAYVPTQIGQPVTMAWGTGLESVFKQFHNVTYQAFDGQMKAEIQVTVLKT